MWRFWHRMFLQERPSLSLGFFRVAVAVTVGAHMLPALLRLDEQFLSTAFMTQNSSFFPEAVLRWAAAWPDAWIVAFAVLFCLSLAGFTLGLFTQASCLLMTLCCYAFYARNTFYIGTLSFDILLVTLFLMCVSAYPGDALSLDALRRGDARAWRRRRPFFLQRLLQLQLAGTYWHTALNKFTAGGNWLTGNPWFNLMRYPAIGVVRHFPGRAWLAVHPDACYAIGLGVVTMELTLPVLWFLPRTRRLGIALGCLFHLGLWATLHVPTIFLFLFPPMMLLFVDPEVLVGWIEARQQHHAVAGRAVLVYDGQCGVSAGVVRRVLALDLFGWVDPVDVHTQPALGNLHPWLTPERCKSSLVLIEPNGTLAVGLDAMRRVSRHIASLWPVAPLFHVPGMGWIARRLSVWAARHRGWLHRSAACAANQCAAAAADASSEKTSS